MTRPPTEILLSGMDRRRGPNYGALIDRVESTAGFFPALIKY